MLSLQNAFDESEIRAWDWRVRAVVGEEVSLPIRSFERINQELETAGRQPFMTPRNAAAGSVRQLDPRVTAGRNLQTYMYALDPAGPAQSQCEVLELLDSFGFRVNPNRVLCSSIDEVIAYHERWQARRHQLDHEIDGLVVKVDRHDQQLELGFVARSP